MTTVLKQENNPFAMAYDYIKYRLSLDEEEWYDCPDLPDVTDAIMAMRILATDFEHQNKSKLTEMLGRLNLDSNMIYPEFTKVAKELFTDTINYGRVVALYAFTGMLVSHCVADELSILVRPIADFLAIYTRNQIKPWVEQQKDEWMGLQLMLY
jgi:BCL2-like 1 (apoptosis regulator Bcl-X)